MAAPTNTTFTDALDITADLAAGEYLASIADIDLTPGALHPTYYTFLTQDYGIGVLVWAQASQWRPRTTLWDGTLPTPTQVIDANNISNHQPGIFPLTPGVRYWLRVQDDGFGATFTNPLQISVIPHPNLAAPAGSILVNDDTPPYHALLLDQTTQDPLRYRPLIQGEDAAMLPSGVFCLTNDDTAEPDRLYIYDTDFTQLAVTDIPDTFGYMNANLTNDLTKFYYGTRQLSSGGLNSWLNSITAAGVIEQEIALLPSHNPFTWAMNSAGTTLYTCRSGTGVKVFDVASQTFLADLAARPSVGANAERDSFCLSDGSVVVCWITASQTYLVRRYDGTTGATISDFNIVYAHALTDGPRMAIGPGELYAVVWASRAVPVTGERLSRFVTFNLADGTTITDNEVPIFQGGLGGIYSLNTMDKPRFGNSKSCPVLVLRAAGGDATDPNTPTWRLIGIDLSFQKLIGLQRPDPE